MQTFFFTFGVVVACARGEQPHEGDTVQQVSPTAVLSATAASGGRHLVAGHDDAGPPPPPCWDTPLLNATTFSGVEAHVPDPAAGPANTLGECQSACCGSELCVGWTFDAAAAIACSLYTERGVLARAAPGAVSAYRAMSVPPDGSWAWSWDTVPMFTHSSNASGLYSVAALDNLSKGYPVVGLDWEVNYTATHSHQLRQSTVAQAQAIVAVAPATKVLVYQQGFLALNFSDAEGAAIQNRSKDSFWIHNADGSVYEWDAGGNNPAYCAYGQHCARVMNSSVPEMRRWYVEQVALPTLAEDGVGGLFVDNSMQLGMPPPSQGAPWLSLALQRGAAQLHREVGEAMLAQHPGKRTLLSVQQILFTDNQPPLPHPDSDCAGNPSPCFFVLSGACPTRGLTVFFVDMVKQQKAWVPSCVECGLNVCDAEPHMRNMTCAELDALKDVALNCSAVPQQPQQLITEQELLTYWKDIPWGRYYDGAEPEQPTISAQTPQHCVQFVRNMQVEALSGIPTIAGAATGPLTEPAFQKALAMFLMAAEKHSRFGYQRGYVCSEPGRPLAPGLPPVYGTNTSCTWLWREEFERRLGPPVTWASWDGGFKFERQFQFLNVSLDCSTGLANFSWDQATSLS